MKKKTDRKSKNIGNLLGTIFFSLIGMGCGIATILYFDSVWEGNLSLFQFLLIFIFLFWGMFAAFILQIIIHEAGHLVFGLLTGYRFSSFRIGNFIWIKENGKIRLRRLSLAGTAGQCLMCPPEMINEKFPFVLYNLGGSLMNLATVPLFIGMLFLCKNIFYLPLFFLTMSIVGFAYALMNGIPLRLGIVDNDGENAKSLGKNPHALRSFWVQMKTNEQIAKGTRLKDLPDEWFTIPSDADMTNSMTAALAVFSANRFMDAHAFKEAETFMDQLLAMDSGMVGLHRNLIICDRLYCELIDNKNNDVIEKLRSKEQLRFMKQMRNFLSVIRTEYVFALLYENDFVKADTLKTQFEKCAKTYPYASDIKSEQELIQIADQKARELHG